MASSLPLTHSRALPLSLSLSLSPPLSLSLRSVGPHVLSVTTFWVSLLWEGGEASRSAIPDFMGTRLVPQDNVPWYTIDRMRLYQAMERTARPQGPAAVRGGVGRARIGMPFIAPVACVVELSSAAKATHHLRVSEAPLSHAAARPAVSRIYVLAVAVSAVPFVTKHVVAVRALAVADVDVAVPSRSGLESLPAHRRAPHHEPRQ